MSSHFWLLYRSLAGIYFYQHEILALQLIKHMKMKKNPCKKSNSSFSKTENHQNFWLGVLLIWQAMRRILLSFSSQKRLRHTLCSNGKKDASWSKGQVITKGLFGKYPQFSRKTNKKIRLYYYGTSSQTVFVRYLG